jgi:hypothetical protein
MPAVRLLGCLDDRGITRSVNGSAQGRRRSADVGSTARAWVRAGGTTTTGGTASSGPATADSASLVTETGGSAETAPTRTVARVGRSGPFDGGPGTQLASCPALFAISVPGCPTCPTEATESATVVPAPSSTSSSRSILIRCHQRTIHRAHDVSCRAGDVSDSKLVYVTVEVRR